MIFKSSILVTAILLLGLSVSYYILMPEIDSTEPAYETIRILLKSIPTWYGAVAGIFGSTLLSHLYAIKKQQLDDEKKELRENISNAGKAMSTIVDCIEKLKKAKADVVYTLNGDSNPTRSFKVLRSIDEISHTKSIDISTLLFLLKERNHQKKHFINLIEVSSEIDEFNDIVAKIKYKNILGKRTLEMLFKEKHAAHELRTFNISDTSKLSPNTFNTICEYIKITESLFTDIDRSIDQLSVAAIDLSSAMKLYMKENNITPKFYSIENPDEIFQRISYIDIDKEINVLASNYHSRKKINPSNFKY